MSHSEDAFAQISDLLSQAESMSESLDLRGLLDVFGRVERFRRFLDWRISNFGGASGNAKESRVDVLELVRTLATEVRPPEPHRPAEATRKKHANGLLTIPQAAEVLGLSAATIRSWLSQHKVPVVKLGRAVRLKETDIRKLIEEGYIPARNRPATS
jgi:excisionase family DNA binding protein